jgi:hypothetical protein
MTEPDSDVPDDRYDLPRPNPRLNYPAGDAPLNAFLEYELGLLGVARRHAVMLCSLMAELFDRTSRSDPDPDRDAVHRSSISQAIQTLYGGPVGKNVFIVAQGALSDARHLIEPVGTEARFLPEIPPGRFGGSMPLVRIVPSAHEAAVGAPGELLMLLLIRHHAEGVLTAEELVPEDADGRLHIPIELRLAFAERCDVGLIRAALHDPDPQRYGDHYRDLARRVTAESHAAAEFARETYYRKVLSGEPYRPPRPVSAHFSTPLELRAYSEGSEGPIDGTDFFRFRGKRYLMPSGKPADLIRLLWSIPGREASFTELEGAGLWEADGATLSAVKKVISLGNGFFEQPSPATPLIQMPYRLSKVERLDRVRMVTLSDDP